MDHRIVFGRALIHRNSTATGLAMLHRLGLYATEACADADAQKSLRIALDAFVCALSHS